MAEEQAFFSSLLKRWNSFVLSVSLPESSNYLESLPPVLGSLLIKISIFS